MLGDIQISEPGALICFAGPRVIEETIREKLPEGFQRAEFLLEKGMLDMVVHRRDMKETLSRIVDLIANKKRTEEPASEVIEEIEEAPETLLAEQSDDQAKAAD